MALMTVGEVRENIIKALTCPEHINSVVGALYVKGAVLAEKRKSLVNKRKRKHPEEPIVMEVLEEGDEEDPSLLQDLN